MFCLNRLLLFLPLWEARAGSARPRFPQDQLFHLDALRRGSVGALERWAQARSGRAAVPAGALARTRTIGNRWGVAGTRRRCAGRTAAAAPHASWPGG